ncbi:MAG: Tetratricopeptide repeat protein [Polyangiaceae bacterium]|jgi:tetratricopeptide (TPR) repeat protein|nr:Tetratricopeptide repeat protein [Polyangiaceae bacterium]
MQRFRACAATTVALFALACPAWAESNAHFSEAQRAYAAVDYEATLREANAGLEEGGNDQSATGELYVLLGTAAAALGRTDEARLAFSHALAVNPALKLDRNLSPKMRAPYQEARGNAITAEGKPPLHLALARRKQELELSLRDQLQVASSSELWTRDPESGAFSRRSFGPARVQRVPLPSGTELQYYLRVLDRHSNVLFESGTSEEPLRLALEHSGPSRSSTPSTDDVNRTPYLVTASSLAILGLAAGGVATAMFARREDAARDWNGPGCEQPGSTRRAQCGEVDARRRNAEHLGVGFAAGGGALLVGGLLTWLLTPATTTRTNVDVDTSPQGVMVRLRTAL